MGRLYQRPRSPFLWADYYDGNGQRVRVSTGTANPKEARRFLKLREGKVAEGIPLPPRLDRVTYEQLRDNLVTFYETTGKWKDLAEAKRRMAHLTRYFAGRRVVTITPPVIRAYAEQRLADKVPHTCGEHPHRCRTVAPATVNRELAMLRRMLRLGAKDRLVASVPPIDMLREAAPRAGFVDEAQYRSLLRHLRPDLRAVVAIAYNFGWRARSEILTLERRHVDLEAGTLRLDPGMAKNRDGRLVYMTPEVRQLAAAQLERVDALAKKLAKDSPVPRLIPYLFPHLTGAHRGQRIEEFRKAWRKATRAAGLPGLLVHDLRRSAVRNMEQRGVPRSVAMKLTGHRTESVYKRYAIVSDADLRDAARKIGAGTLPGTLTGISENGARQVGDILYPSR